MSTASVLLLISCQLYCQNLSLFGKLFIDIKTLFFDCDNCVCSVPCKRVYLLIRRGNISFILYLD